MMLGGRSNLGPGFNPGRPKETDWPSIATLVKQTVKPNANLPPSMVLPEKLVHRTGRVIPVPFSLKGFTAGFAQVN